VRRESARTHDRRHLICTAHARAYMVHGRATVCMATLVAIVNANPSYRRGLSQPHSISCISWDPPGPIPPPPSRSVTTVTGSRRGPFIPEVADEGFHRLHYSRGSGSWVQASGIACLEPPPLAAILCPGAGWRTSEKPLPKPPTDSRNKIAAPVGQALRLCLTKLRGCKQHPRASLLSPCRL